jgi:hypothetical protein
MILIIDGILQPGRRWWCGVWANNSDQIQKWL